VATTTIARCQSRGGDVEFALGYSPVLCRVGDLKTRHFSSWVYAAQAIRRKGARGSISSRPVRTATGSSHNPDTGHGVPESSARKSLTHSSRLNPSVEGPDRAWHSPVRGMPAPQRSLTMDSTWASAARHHHPPPKYGTPQKDAGDETTARTGRQTVYAAQDHAR